MLCCIAIDCYLYDINTIDCYLFEFTIVNDSVLKFVLWLISPVPCSQASVRAVTEIELSFAGDLVRARCAVHRAVLFTFALNGQTKPPSSPLCHPSPRLHHSANKCDDPVHLRRGQLLPCS